MGFRLHERDEELRTASQLLRDAREHRGGALFFTGDPGLGKTALLHRVTRDAAASFRVGAAVGDPVETSVAFGLLGQAIYELGGPVPLADASETMPGETAPSVSDVRSARFHRVLRWLREISEPTVLTLDDAHWADSDSLAMLSFLCRRLTGLPVAVVVTLRSWPPAACDVVRRLQAAGHAGLAELAPLSAQAARQVLTSQVRGEPDPATISRAIEICAGNPMLLEQVSVLIDRGDDLSSPRLSRELPDPRSLLLSWVAALPEEVVRCARAASVLGTRFRPQLAAQIARTPDEGVEQTLDALVRSGLIREVPGHLAEFAHHIFGQLLYDDLGAALRDRLHHRACRVLLDQGLEQEAAQHAMRGDITGDPEIIGVLERVGLEALRQGAVGSAIEHLRAAVAHSGHRASRTALTGLSEALLAGGQFREAIACCERLVDMHGAQPGERAEALMVHATGLAQSGRLNEACDRLEETVAAARETDLALAVDAETERGYYRWWLDGPAAAVPILARARDMAGEAPCRSKPRANAMWGFATLQAGDPAGFTEVAAASRDVLAAPDAHLRDFTTTWGTLASFAVSAMLTERFPEAEQAYVTALGAAERSGASLTAGVLGLNVSYAALLLRLGRLDEALHLTSRVLDLADVMPALALTASVIHAETLLDLGRLEESSVWLSRAESVPAFRTGWEPMLRLHGIRGHHALRAGNWENASERFLAAEELAEGAGVGEPCFSMQARHAVLAHLRADRRSDAERVLSKLDARAATLPCRWPRIAALSARAELAELAGDTPTANAAYTEALRLHAGLTLPLERIETLLEFGTFLRRASAYARARPLLAEAVRAAEATGAGWLAAQAHRELIASGGRRRRRGDMTGRLTPQERRVSELAAQGLSNEAIAGRLRVSPGTVKTHLEHIYAKLGVHSRRELILQDRTKHPPYPN
jgi:ATP/maltotriose-dependent transcriptional regulator MalT